MFEDLQSKAARRLLAGKWPVNRGVVAMLLTGVLSILSVIFVAVSTEMIYALPERIRCNRASRPTLAP